jgi:hypothetical protein
VQIYLGLKKMMIEILSAGAGIIAISVVVSIGLVIGTEMVLKSINGDLD